MAGLHWCNADSVCLTSLAVRPILIDLLYFCAHEMVWCIVVVLLLHWLCVAHARDFVADLIERLNVRYGMKTSHHVTILMTFRSDFLWSNGSLAFVYMQIVYGQQSK